MGMRINGGGGGYASGAQDAQWQQRRQNFDALAQAIAGGNLSNANDAFAKIQSSLPPGRGTNPNGFLGQIGAALQSGDIATAQQVLTARMNGSGNQPSIAVANQQASSAATVGAASAAGAASAVGATSVSGGTTTAAAGYGRHGHHHHHGGGDSSPALALSQAIQSGDTATAQSSMQTILTDLQQVASLGSLSNPTTSAATPSAAISSAVSAANSLLQNPDFQALEDAVAKGDATATQSAWTKLISGASSASGTTTASTAASASVATPPTPVVA